MGGPEPPAERTSSCSPADHSVSGLRASGPTGTGIVRSFRIGTTTPSAVSRAWRNRAGDPELIRITAASVSASGAATRQSTNATAKSKDRLKSRPGPRRPAQRDERHAPDLVQAVAAHRHAELVEPGRHADVGQQRPAAPQDPHQILVAAVAGEADDDAADAAVRDRPCQVRHRAEGRRREVKPRRPVVENPAGVRPSSGCSSIRPAMNAPNVPVPTTTARSVR